LKSRAYAIKAAKFDRTSERAEEATSPIPQVHHWKTITIRRRKPKKRAGGGQRNEAPVRKGKKKRKTLGGTGNKIKK